MEMILMPIEQFRQLLRAELAGMQPPQQDTPPPSTNGGTGQVMDMGALCETYGFLKGTIYKKTSEGSMPYSKRGKKLYFEKSKIEAWLLENSNGYKSKLEIAKSAKAYITKKDGQRKF
jgi:predicted DNA-binding transcriptional regulator AlpA